MRWQRIMDGMTLNITGHAAYRCISKEFQRRKKKDILKGASKLMQTICLQQLRINIEGRAIAF